MPATGVAWSGDHGRMVWSPSGSHWKIGAVVVPMLMTEPWNTHGVKTWGSLSATRRYHPDSLPTGIHPWVVGVWVHGIGVTTATSGAGGFHPLTCQH
jgi:hypothetical protein